MIIYNIIEYYRSTPTQHFENMDLQISSELRIWSTGRCHIHLAVFSSLHSRGDIAMPSFSPEIKSKSETNKFFALQKHSNLPIFRPTNGFFSHVSRIFQDHHSTNQSSTRWQSFHPWSRWRSPWRAQNGMCVCCRYVSYDQAKKKGGERCKVR